MKRLLIVACVILLSATAGFAQRYAVVDTRYIFEKMPEYKTVQKSIDDILNPQNFFDLKVSPIEI